MCETRDLGIRWAQWHTLMFSDEIAIDMRLVCPKDVLKKCWYRGADQCTGRSGAAKHGYEELKRSEYGWNQGQLCSIRK